jgi:hypothetical protein
LNPMIKVINLISLLFAGVLLSLRNILTVQIPNTNIQISIVSTVLSIILIGIIAGAIMYSKRETKEEERVLDVEGPIPSDVLAEPNPVEASSPFALSAMLDDSATGGSKIVSAEYSLDGTTWLSMYAADGALDSPKEKIIAKLSVAKPGVYNLMVRGSDELGNIASEKGTVLVVYDPNAGFVTGDGWIDSPSGAYPANPTLIGKAAFRFVSHYEKGVTVPTGQTEFTLDVAGMAFKSTSYDWLVVSGARAQCKGTGTINGAGNYGFTLIVTDERIKGGGRINKFRIKIWDKTTGRIIYDNNLGYPDNVTPITAISGGSIVIYAKRALGKHRTNGPKQENEKTLKKPEKS